MGKSSESTSSVSGNCVRCQSRADILNIDEISKELSVPKQTIYTWVHQRKIPYFKVGRHLRFDYQEVLEYFRSASRDHNTSAFSKLRRFSSLAIEEKKRGNLNKGGRYGDL